jgi:hypothetical protein
MSSYLRAGIAKVMPALELVVREESLDGPALTLKTV